MQKKILLIITGSIAAFKAAELVSSLKKLSIDVTCVLTNGAKKFISPLTFAALSGNPVYSELFSLKSETEMGHIRLSREADLIVVAPASCDIIAKFNAGLADDLASSTLLAANKPILMAPAMNTQMWNSAATKRNIKQLINDGVKIIQPSEGLLACHEVGIGKMAMNDDIIAEIQKQLGSQVQDLLGKKVLVTAGPTVEAIDPVRFISNYSSGKQGYAIATELAERGAKVTLISGPVNLIASNNIQLVQVHSAEEMMTACLNALPADIAICTAAVSDWSAAEIAPEKLKKTKQDTFQLTLKKNPDILATLANHQHRPKLVIGFAAETSNLNQNATKKLQDKNCDWLLANDVSSSCGTFGGEMNQILFLSETTQEQWPLISKQEVAKRLVDKIALSPLINISKL